MIPERDNPADPAWNEDDEFFAEAMAVVLEQALGAELPDLSNDEVIRVVLVLLARQAVESGAIRQILDARLERRDGGEPWSQ